jgi:hypothetical protein
MPNHVAPPHAQHSCHANNATASLEQRAACCRGQAHCMSLAGLLAAAMFLPANPMAATPGWICRGGQCVMGKISCSTCPPPTRTLSRAPICTAVTVPTCLTPHRHYPVYLQPLNTVLAPVLYTQPLAIYPTHHTAHPPAHPDHPPARSTQPPGPPYSSASFSRGTMFMLCSSWNSSLQA